MHIKLNRGRIILPRLYSNDNMEKYILNHFYKLHHDLKRTYIVSSIMVGSKQYKIGLNENWLSKIHPIYAMILSFFSEPVNLLDVSNKISSFLEVSGNTTNKILEQLINNDEIVSSEYEECLSIFPRNIIIKESEAFAFKKKYEPSQFVYTELDFKQERFYKAPIGIVYIINNTCLTECVYCYADKRLKRSTLPLAKIEELIKEAYDLDVLTFTISGGEFFLFKKWEEVLNALYRYSYKLDIISTKVPISEATISKLKKFDIPIQISLDSLNANSLVAILNVSKNYVDKIKNTIMLLEKHNINFQVATVLTKYNSSTFEIYEIYNFLKDLKNLHRWEIRESFRSLYSRDDFNQIKLSSEQFNEIDIWVSKMRKENKLGFELLWAPNVGKKYFSGKEGSKSFEGSRCSATYSHMVVLPDGNVTICEQLYWKEDFIIGDIKEQSISEIWNSEKALGLAFPENSFYNDNSACKNCELLDQCISYPNKCYADVIKAYGDENWDFPDPRCAKAPKFVKELTH